ncbi:MAG: gamma-glutamyltransferase family protein [Acidimicrobiales bacterium]
MLAPVPTLDAPRGMVAAPDHLAAQAGLQMLRAGGSAVDAIVATSAVLAVTFQHACGMGGDLWAIVHPGEQAGEGEEIVVLDSSGRAGSGADLRRLLDEGHTAIPALGHPAAVPVPGCVDGWCTLHDRFGRLPLRDVLAPARWYAESGFPASTTLASAVPRVLHLPEAADFAGPGALRPGQTVRRPGVARALDAIAGGGRDAFYLGEFGDGLLELGRGEYRPEDLERSQASWVAPLSVEAFGARLWSAPPASQGYLTLSSAWIADGLPLPEDPGDPAWAHLLVEAARQAGWDRPEVLWEGAEGAALLAEGRLGPRREAIRADATWPLPGGWSAGGTIACVAVGPDRQGVTLMQSNASGFGSHLIVPGVRIFLHNRGLGFSLRPGHPAAYGPGRRPPHTLCPTLVTAPGGGLAAVLGTMGGDSQPQVLLQLLARLLRSGQGPAEALAAGRWQLTTAEPGPGAPAGFDTWGAEGSTRVVLEGQVPPGWAGGLSSRGHAVEAAAAFSSSFGHAHAIVVGDGNLRGGTDPRTEGGGVAGW